MHYKTIDLELLRERTELHDQLRQQRLLLSAVDFYARELRESHQAWKELLTELRPASDRSQLASEAFEMALKELQYRLPSESHQNGSEAVFLDAAMMFIRHHTSRA